MDDITVHVQHLQVVSVRFDHGEDHGGLERGDVLWDDIVSLGSVSSSIDGDGEVLGREQEVLGFSTAGGELLNTKGQIN